MRCDGGRCTGLPGTDSAAPGSPFFGLTFRVSRTLGKEDMMRSRRPLIFLVLIAIAMLGWRPGFAEEDATPAAPPDDGNPDQSGTVSLELRTWLCPTGIARDDFDFAADCEDAPLEGVTFQLAEPRGAGSADPGASSQTTGPDGSLQWAESWMDENVYTLQQDEASLAALDLEIVDYVVRCSAGDGPAGSAPAEDYALASVFLDIPAETTVTCDWYNLPADDEADGGSVTIQAFAYLAGYASTDECTEPAAGESLDVAFGPTGGETTVETDAGGTVTIETPAPSAALRLDGVTASRLSCTDAEREELELDPVPTWFRATPSYVSLDIVAGEDASCDWYIGQGEAASPQMSEGAHPAGWY